MPALNPYLNFDGNCKQAFEFYADVFKTQPVTAMKFSDVPAEYQGDPSEADLIMHIALPIGHSILMGSDKPAKFGKGTRGDMQYISISADSEEEAREIFSKLAEGGKVFMPLEKAFWGDLFGMTTDKFGVAWMMSYRPTQQ